MRAETRIPVAVHCEMQSIVMFSELLAVSSLHWLITDSTKLPNSPHDIHLQLMYLWIVFAIVLLVLFYYAGTCWLCHVRLRSQWPANRGNSFELLIPLCFRSWSVFFPVLCNNLMCLVLESVAVSGALLTVTLGSSFIRHRHCLCRYHCQQLSADDGDSRKAGLSAFSVCNWTYDILHMLNHDVFLHVSPYQNLPV